MSKIIDNMSNYLKGDIYKSIKDKFSDYEGQFDVIKGNLESFVEDWFKPLAYALIMLRKEGLPCVFYGDFYGIEKHNFKGFKLFIERLLSIRKKYVYGNQTDYFNDKGLIGWTGCAVVLSNREGVHTKRMYIGTRYANMKFVDILGYVPKEITIDSNGYGQFKCDGISVSCWVPEA